MAVSQRPVTGADVNARGVRRRPGPHAGVRRAGLTASLSRAAAPLQPIEQGAQRLGVGVEGRTTAQES
jgi:hypothetical protein